MEPRARPLLIATATLAALATVLVSASETLSFGYRSGSVHVAIETAATVVAVLAAYLSLGRFRATRRLDDLALFTALLILAITNLAFSLTLALAGREADGFFVWAPLAGRTLAAAAFAAAAFAPQRILADPRRALRAASAATAAAVTVAALLSLAGSGIETGIDPELSPASSDHPRIVGSPLLLGAQLAAMVLYGVAAAGFARRAHRVSDELITWVAVGTTLAAFSRLNYFLFPSIYSNYVFTGDVLRLAFYLAILVGVLRALAAYQREVADAAAAEERRRVGRELHDGLAQELAFISMQTRRLVAKDADPRLEQLAQAAERALDESRAAIAVFARAGRGHLADDLAESAAMVTGRAGVKLRTTLDRTVRAGHETHAALMRIVREAATNAIRHGGAREVSVSVATSRPGWVRVSVADDGRGFEPADLETSANGGYGLSGMRERGASLGGTVEIRSRPGEGTTVEVELPCDAAS